ncbi:phosphoadenylyl-sulfate reductase [Deferribacter autotrophicus]|uniref:Adenosine 5'-phosphosulfate reductase n=1 Tax=Deferribacter autotrophicus TaxID=500465 RepID=A0A5A8F1A7_9BACT|nr:phosphoadenylyl-sulfate reductase [Deferribacter autotrophicus]KAA0257161.1 phosphoadenylyl-sulfate reductase [Deferribacter autotrophicus]
MQGIYEIIKKLKHVHDNEILNLIVNNYSSVSAFSTSLGPEDQVITHMLSQLDKDRNIHVFTLDTGRLFEETYRLLDETQKALNIAIKVYFPDFNLLEDLVNNHGINLFYESEELRKKCCYVRKIEPLKRAFKDKLIWITGLRKEQSTYRKQMELIEYDENFKIIKVNPLINWDRKQIWDYIVSNNVPFNELHKKGFLSIGCAPCTRSVHPGEDERAGRWWWELESKKECGLHFKE